MPSVGGVASAKREVTVKMPREVGRNCEICLSATFAGRERIEVVNWFR